MLLIEIVREVGTLACAAGAVISDGVVTLLAVVEQSALGWVLRAQFLTSGILVGICTVSVVVPRARVGLGQKDLPVVFIFGRMDWVEI